MVFSFSFLLSPFSFLTGKRQKRIIKAAIDTTKVEVEGLCKELGTGGKASAQRLGWPANNVYGASKLLAFTVTRQLALFSYMAAAKATGAPTHLDVKQLQQKKSGISKKQTKLLQQKLEQHQETVDIQRSKWWWEAEEIAFSGVIYSAVCKLSATCCCFPQQT